MRTKIKQIMSFQTLILSILVFAFTTTLKAELDPTLCDWGSDVSWGTLQTAYAVNAMQLFGCSDDLDCIITVEYYERQVDWGNGPEWEFQIKSIKLENCDAECSQYIWKAALWLIFKKREVALGLDNEVGCTENFYYKAVSCWHQTQVNPPYGAKTWEACGGDCCVGYYKVCLTIGVNGERTYNFTLLDRLNSVTNNCVAPCLFYSCDQTIPPDFDVNDTPVIIGKQNVEIMNSDFINIYPNPVKNNLTFEVSNEINGILGVSIFDALGNRVLEFSDFKRQYFYSRIIELPSLSSGLLNIRVKIGNDVIINKIFIKE